MHGLNEELDRMIKGLYEGMFLCGDECENVSHVF